MTNLNKLLSLRRLIAQLIAGGMLFGVPVYHGVTRSLCIINMRLKSCLVHSSALPLIYLRGSPFVAEIECFDNLQYCAKILSHSSYVI